MNTYQEYNNYSQRDKESMRTKADIDTAKLVSDLYDEIVITNAKLDILHGDLEKIITNTTPKP